MDDSSLYSKINFLNSQTDQRENLTHFSLDIQNSFYNSFTNNDKYLSTKYNEFDNKSFFSNDFENIFKEEKETNFNNANVSNKEDVKKQLRLKRNRESAKEGRLRKKNYIENLINELKELRFQNSILLKTISKCPKCKEEYEKEKKNNEEKKENNYILSDGSSFSKRTKVLFMTAITFISILNILNIFSFNQGAFKIRELRNLSVKKQSEILLNKIKSENEENALLIHLAEFYSLTTREKVDGNNDLNNEVNKNIKIYNNDTFNVNTINQTKAQNCVKCMVEIDKNSIKMGGDEFTFYLVDRSLSKNFMNNLEDGLFPELNFEKENKKSETFSKLFALRCKIIAYSMNNIYSENIQSIS